MIGIKIKKLEISRASRKIMMEIFGLLDMNKVYIKFPVKPVKSSKKIFRV